MRHDITQPKREKRSQRTQPDPDRRQIKINSRKKINQKINNVRTSFIAPCSIKVKRNVFDEIIVRVNLWLYLPPCFYFFKGFVVWWRPYKNTQHTIVNI